MIHMHAPPVTWLQHKCTLPMSMVWLCHQPSFAAVPVAKGLMLWALLSSRVRGPTPTATLGSQHRVSLWVMPPPPCTPVSVHAPPSWGTAASQLHHHTVSAVPCPQAVWMHSMRQPLQELIMCGSDHGSSRRLGGHGGPKAMERWPINRMCVYRCCLCHFAPVGK